ncbi:MAG: dTDP-4-dehydrorhamnose 3,5-epimerase family protein [Gemmatimonadaceae bacterium]|nr:dTDP-4-dehydrorhamnose 3,5-epimerase family protein [Gemmatimonadaceae bacterium]
MSSAVLHFEPLAIPGAWEVRPRRFEDARGSFVKVFVRSAFDDCGLETDFDEQYHSVSVRGVLRGLHFQVPPVDHAKLVYCAHGSVLDAVVDLRIGSPTYRQAATVQLRADVGNALYVPRGLAHGFLVTSESALMVYNVTSEHAPAADTGIRWDSAGIAWPERAPTVSPRDTAFERLSDFVSPFRFDATADAPD